MTTPDADAPLESWMRRALALAERGRGRVEPNPMVGALLVKDGKVVAEGWHGAFGAPHAEIEAIRTAGEAARGAMLVVSLEPCAHQGKTPPCAGALVQAGVSSVVAAHLDPDPRVSGRGVALLRRTGIDVRMGVCGEEARELNAPYLKRIETGRPWWIAKWALSRDGAIASRGGRPLSITGAAAKREAHALRGRSDAVVVGIGTVLADDPLLTCRESERLRVARRVVLDGKARTPPGGRLLRSVSEGPVWIVTGPEALEGRKTLLRAAGAVVVEQPGAGRRGWDDLGARLAAEGCTNILVEGGGSVLRDLFEHGAADEAHLFLSTSVVGGKDPLPGPWGTDVTAGGVRLRGVRISRLDDDLWIRGRVEARRASASASAAHPS
ncbi:MAG: bifunctional diaminohydroxyphosphoribosylaminopyrimidine deaminase/5-amino-6-(5-phosphoribosylamino)uracil reductase RibD [Planctomycetes bacterium]|nr:bifunctional diaminohydroxyphosphoribosylaminopyrimidine deaminase/5-amino-6-(5-phosphoribosylamino)uracil reductase RibD [Planctomycetota bacterium]